MKKKDLTTAGIYLVIGAICFAALVLTDSKLDSLLIAGAAVGLLEGVVKIGNYVYWRRPENQAEYREMQESEQIEQQDELMQMLRDQAYRHAYITNLRVTMAAALICGALKYGYRNPTGFRRWVKVAKSGGLVNGKPHTWSKKVPPFQAASINYSNVFNLQYSGIFSDHGSKSSM